MPHDLDSLRNEGAPELAAPPPDSSVQPQLARAWTAAALELARRCTRATPLARHAAALAPAGQGEGRVPERCVVEALDEFEADLARWGGSAAGPEELFDRLPLQPNLLATFFHRMSRALFRAEVPLVPDVLAAVSRIQSGAELYYSAEIGPGLKLIHGVGTVIGSGCRIGARFTVYQGVTVGDKLGRDTGDRPILGDDVIASAGSQILGPITIGSKTVIGANAVVVHSLPGRCVAVGVPARVKAENLSDEEFAEFTAAIKG